MAKNRNNKEAEKNKKKDSGLLKKAVGVAAIAGVGYAGFKNRGNISNFIKKTEGAANRLAIRGASNPELRGVTRQLGNITGGITDTVGENPGLKGFGRFLLNNSDEALDKNIQNRIARSMSSSRTNNIVSSLESKREGLNAAGRITARAKEADKQHQIQKLLTEKGRMQNFFGENTESVMAMLKDSRNSKLLQKDEIAKSGNPESFNRRIKEFLIDNHEGSGRASENTFKLKFNRQAEKETGEFQGKMMEFLDEVNERTSQNVKNYSAIKNGKKVSSKMMEDNVFSKQIQLQEAIAFKGLRESSSPKNSASRMSKSLEARGFRMSTIDDALNFEMTSGQKLGDEFAHARFSTGNQEKIIKENLAKTYKNKAENYGLNYNEFKDDIFAKEIFIHNKTGEVLNTSYLDNAIEKGNTFGQEHFQVPFLKFNPWDILQYKNQLNKKKAPVFDIFKSGEVLPFMDQAKLKTGVPFELRNLNASTKPIANDYLYSGSKLYSTDFSGYNGKTSKDAFNFLEENLSSLVVEDNLSLVNVKSGFYKRFGESVSGRTNISTKDTPGPIKTLFGFGQEEESVFSRGRRAFKKFDDPLYSGNLIDTLYSTENAEEAENVVNRMYNLLYGQTKEMSADTRNATYDTLSKVLNTKYGTTDINLAKMSDDDGILEVAQQIAKYSNKNKSTIETSVTKQIEDSLESHISNSFNNFYGKSDTQFNASKRFLKDRNVVTNEMISSMNMYPDREVPQVKDLKRLIEEFSISSAERQNITVQDLIKDSMKNGNYTSTVENELYQMNSLGKISFFREKVRNDNSKEFEAGVNSLKQFLSESSEETASLHYSLKKADPWYGTGVGDSPFEEILGQSAVRTPIKKHRGMLETINAEFTDNGAVGVAKSYADSVGSLFAGAKNRDKITDATSLSYFMTSRLDSALTQVGLGLPNSQKGSAQAILFNQWGRRIVLPYMAFQTAKYADGLTGDNFSDGAADAYVNMHEDVARFKDITGLNALGKGVANYLPGYDQIQEWAPVKALNKVTFGLFGDNRSGDEVRKYYESGEDPIRKGRFWGIGSTSMWMGDKVDRYEPNWYRKLKSDYQFSENMYGSEKEYWANNWMPTLTNPFAPIKHFITDPYHYENKHKEDRPYAVTGGFDELNQIPLIGPVVDSVVSGILKPTRTDSRLKASHKEYLTEYNEQLARSYTSLNTGGQIESSPGGGYSFKPNAIDVQIRDEDGNLDEESLQDDYLYQKSESGGRNGYVASVAMGAPGFRGGSANATALGSPNLGVVSQAGARGKGSVSSGIAGSSVRQILSTMNRNLSDNSSNPGAVSASQVGSFENPGTVFNLNDTTNLQDLSSLDGPLRDVIYNAGEIGGMFGFLGKTAAGFEESGRGAVLESSERFGSYNNSFWNKELGGLGGDISEIFRRYLPRDPNKNYYNPIRNTMPGWMPGAEYFTDFKHGDPYSKVASGEMRLPGEA